MSGDPSSAPGTSDSPPAALAAEPNGPRPWTPAAAMEPVPPLAPPPARPGAGTPVVTSARGTSSRASVQAVVGLVALALVAVTVVIVLLLLGH